MEGRTHQGSPGDREKSKGAGWKVPAGERGSGDGLVMGQSQVQTPDLRAEGQEPRTAPAPGSWL